MIETDSSVASEPIEYMNSDAGIVPESDLHRDIQTNLIETLRWWFSDDQQIYISGNLSVFFLKNKRRGHVYPDVFVVPGVGNHSREQYMVWHEGRGLDVVIEITSMTTQMEDLEDKHNLYVEALDVKELFYFDYNEEYLKPSLRGYRRIRNRYKPIQPLAERVPSEVLGLHLERVGKHLRLWNPADGKLVPTSSERAVLAESENERLRRELEQFRNKRGES